ncbi:MAG: peroxiredoxin [Bacteriovoracaceae bacterium]|jgi:peroxiredoxin
MKNPIQELMLYALDPGISKNIKVADAGTLIQDKTILLSSKRKVLIKELVKNGPLLLTFIRGTWCPFCRLHMQRLRDWAGKLEGRNGSIIVLSSEPISEINQWLESNPVPYMFASDEGSELADYFGVRVKPNKFFQAATFIIDSDLTVRLAYTGKRTKALFKTLNDEF